MQSGDLLYILAPILFDEKEALMTPEKVVEEVIMKNMPEALVYKILGLSHVSAYKDALVKVVEAAHNNGYQMELEEMDDYLIKFYKQDESIEGFQMANLRIVKVMETAPEFPQ